MNMSEQKKKNCKSGRVGEGLAAIAALAAMFVLCFSGFLLLQRNAVPEVDSVVMLDVNPSISLSVDAKEKVLSVDALNADAEEVLGNMELKDTSLEVAVNAIIGSMLQKGYLGDLQNAILVSVENEDTARGEALQYKVAQAVTDAAKNSALDAAVLSQVVSDDDTALSELAAKHSISLGKAALIQEVIAQVPALTFEDLAPMTINEIALIAASKNVSSASVTQSGAASEKAYIGQEEALNAACAHAGVAVEDVIKMDVEFDSENGTMIYEVEFETATQKGEYEIDAVTGQILKAEQKKLGGTEEKPVYISAATAKDTALAYAGVAAEDVLEIKIELDGDEQDRIYTLEFETGSSKYACKINAVTGAVVTFEAEGQKNTSSGNNGTVSSSGSETGNSSGNSSGNVSGNVSNSEPPAATEASVDSGNSGSSYIGESAAKKAALSHAGVAESSTDYVKSYLEYKNDKPAYYCVEFKVNKTEYEYEIDLYSGAILDYDVENHGNSESSSKGNNAAASSGTPESASYIGESAALAIALNHAGVAESSLKERQVELDHDGNTMIYKVELKTSKEGYEYKIDAVSGTVLRAERH